MVAVGGGGRRRRAWRWAMRAAASAVLWTAVVQLASIAGLFRPLVFADCGGGGGAAGGGLGAAAAGLAALAGEDSVAAKLSPPALVPKSEWLVRFSRLGPLRASPRLPFRTSDLGGSSVRSDLGRPGVKCGSSVVRAAAFPGRFGSIASSNWRF